MTSPDTKQEKLVNITFNGISMQVPEKSTVMEVAAKASIAIPHFCWHPGLKVAGVCRFCMVKVEGARKLEIACNLPVREGMVVNSIDDEVKEAHKWALEFHLVNHPLDCPICDQAGECKLQDFYMEVGKYESQVHRPKVLKPKVLDVGRDLILDTERCILCDRCVRFEEEITKTGALGFFDRGDRTIIGTYPGKKLEHNYTTNLVDICPVGAFTSKDFRFKQRVWFLEDKPTTCPGCSTGCAVSVFGKPVTRKYFRVKPRESEINSFWMCNSGRKTYEHLNKEYRLLSHYSTSVGQVKRSACDTMTAITDIAQEIKNLDPKKDIAILVSAQYTNEEYAAIFDFFVNKLGTKKIYQWRDLSESPDDFDGLLERGDRNSNTLGLIDALKVSGIDKKREREFDQFMEDSAKMLIAFAPEVTQFFSSLESDLAKLATKPGVTLLTLSGKAMAYPFGRLISTKGFTEKTGHFTGFDGKPRSLAEKFLPVVKSALDLCEFTQQLQTVYSSSRSISAGAASPELESAQG